MAAEVNLEFMTGNPQLGVLSGRLTYIVNVNSGSGNGSSGNPEEGGKINAGSSNSSGDPVSAATMTGNNGDSSGSLADVSAQSTSGLSILPEHRSTLLCILSVPAHMIPTDMLQFAAPFMEQVHSVRILRPCNPIGPRDAARTPAEYAVLLQMESQVGADDFFLQNNGKRFNSFEEPCCRIVFVAEVIFDLSEPTPTPLQSTPPAAAAISAGVASVIATGGAAACTTGGGGASTTASPVVDTSTNVTGAGIGGNGIGVGAVCIASAAAMPTASVRFAPVAKPGHSSQAAGAAAAVVTSGVGLSAGASAWAYDASTCVICMDWMESQVLTTVCNHSFHVECLMKWQDSPCPVCRFHHNNASESSTCQECQAADHLWVCLICGSVFCGSRHEDHARGHYDSTLHAYSIEIETQQVWDFAGDGFVHRLIHNKADGKLVEISDPEQTSEERPQVPAQLSDVQEERLIHGKLEGLAYQYNTLLASRLDEQRHFYEKQLYGLLEQQEKDRKAQRATRVSGADLISALRQQRRELESKCASASDRLRKTREETDFLWELNRSLDANKEQLSASLQKAERELDSARKTRDEWVPKLEDKVLQLMLKLDAGAGGAGGTTSSTSSSAAAAGRDDLDANRNGKSSTGHGPMDGGDSKDDADIVGKDCRSSIRSRSSMSGSDSRSDGIGSVSSGAVAGVLSDVAELAETTARMTIESTSTKSVAVGAGRHGHGAQAMAAVGEVDGSGRGEARDRPVGSLASVPSSTDCGLGSLVNNISTNSSSHTSSSNNTGKKKGRRRKSK